MCIFPVSSIVEYSSIWGGLGLGRSCFDFFPMFSPASSFSGYSIVRYWDLRVLMIFSIFFMCVFSFFCDIDIEQDFDPLLHSLRHSLLPNNTAAHPRRPAPPLASLATRCKPPTGSSPYRSPSKLPRYYPPSPFQSLKKECPRRWKPR